jgi:hypothetical protein
MPIESKIDPAGPFLHTVFSGEISDVDVLDSAQGTSVMPLGDMPELVDFSGITEDKMTTAGIRRVVEYDKACISGRGPVILALLAESDSTYGMARMYQMLLDSEPNENLVEVFRDGSEAKRWLLARISDKKEVKPAVSFS